LGRLDGPTEPGGQDGNPGEGQEELREGLGAPSGRPDATGDRQEQERESRERFPGLWHRVDVFEAWVRDDPTADLDPDPSTQVYDLLGDFDAWRQLGEVRDALGYREAGAKASSRAWQALGGAVLLAEADPSGELGWQTHLMAADHAASVGQWRITHAELALARLDYGVMLNTLKDDPSGRGIAEIEAQGPEWSGDWLGTFTRLVEYKLDQGDVAGARELIGTIDPPDAPLPPEHELRPDLDRDRFILELRTGEWRSVDGARRRADEVARRYQERERPGEAAGVHLLMANHLWSLPEPDRQAARDSREVAAPYLELRDRPGGLPHTTSPTSAALYLWDVETMSGREPDPTRTETAVRLLDSGADTRAVVLDWQIRTGNLGLAPTPLARFVPLI